MEEPFPIQNESTAAYAYPEHIRAVSFFRKPQSGTRPRLAGKCRLGQLMPKRINYSPSPAQQNGQIVRWPSEENWIDETGVTNAGLPGRISIFMGTFIEILTTLAFILCVRRRVPLGRGLLLALLIFLRRMGAGGFFAILYLVVLVLHFFSHLINAAWQAATGMF